MLTYTTTPNKRDVDKLRLTEEEAKDLAAAGFRFSIFDPERREYRLLAPYKIPHALEKGTLTIMQ